MPGGRLDAETAAEWVLENLLDPKAGATRDAARRLASLSLAWCYAGNVARLVPGAVALAGPHVGLNREATERMANVASLFLAIGLDGTMKALNLPELEIAEPAEWSRRINWHVLFDDTGAPRPEAASLT